MLNKLKKETNFFKKKERGKGKGRGREEREEVEGRGGDDAVPILGTAVN